MKKVVKLTARQLRTLAESVLKELAPDPARFDQSVAGDIPVDVAEAAARDVADEVLQAINSVAMSVVADHMTESGVGGTPIASFSPADVEEMVATSGDLDAVQEVFVDQFAMVFADYVQSLGRIAAEGLYDRT